MSQQLSWLEPEGIPGSFLDVLPLQLLGSLLPPLCPLHPSRPHLNTLPGILNRDASGDTYFPFCVLRVKAAEVFFLKNSPIFREKVISAETINSTNSHVQRHYRGAKSPGFGMRSCVKLGTPLFKPFCNLEESLEPQFPLYKMGITVVIKQK